MKTIAVAQNTFKEAIRDRILYILVIFALVIVLSSKAIGWISIGQDIKVVADFSLAAISLFGVLIAIFVGTNLVFKEIDKRTIYTILSKPVARHQFILGKYIGLMSILFVTVAAMTVGFVLYFVLWGGKPSVVLFKAIFLIYLELAVVTALAVMFSTFTSPIVAAVIVFVLYLIGHLTHTVAVVPPTLDFSAAKVVLKSMYFLLPNLENFNIRSQAAHDIDVTGRFLLASTVYAAVYSTMVLAAAVAIFRRRRL